MNETELRNADGEWNPHLLKSIYALPCWRDLYDLRVAGVVFIYQLVQMTEDDLRKIPSMDYKVEMIKETLTSLGLTLGMNLEGFTPPIYENDTPPPAP